MYHAERGKGKCDLHGERKPRRCFTHWTVRAADAEAQPDSCREKRNGSWSGRMDGRPARPEINQSLNHPMKTILIAVSLTVPKSAIAVTSGYVFLTMRSAMG